LKFIPLESCRAWRDTGSMAGRPRDPIQLAKLIGDIATGETKDTVSDKKRNPRGRAGGLKGGKARAAKLNPTKRKAIAQKAAKARWSE
jgi:hypothetical protein